ncbi:arylsulfatase [Raoultibacter timonensis]|uniref:Uncharacterized protein n=2 Tax=Raoultibacter timonensis TaxID=1907662 RepID=A0ABM7WL55_9ACTN|nr:arylsulfatase [Raoultibacter timonensis]BDE97092.1 hypothetical protein CE91St30_24250 [Raoultibacter timonensis]BDF51696.1 hypothetical protein CE91St31_24260 [Raoultibacter timonensis]
MEWPAQALGFITEPYHQLADDWWFAIPLIAFIFSLITLQCRKSSVVMQRLMTSPSRTKVKRFGKRKFISDKQRNKFPLSRLLEKQRAAGGSEAPRSGGPGAQEAGRAEGGAARRLSRAAASHLPEAAVATLFALPFMAEPAYAYVDPSVMTYTIQALAGVAVALSAVLGVAFRKTRRKLFSLLKIDENARKEVEGDIHRVAAGEPVGDDGAPLPPREETLEGSRAGDAKKDGDDSASKRIRWGARFGYALLASAFLFYTLLVVAPLEIVASNSGSLLVGIEDVGWYMVAFSAGLTIACALLLSALRGKAFAVALAAVTGFAICCYLQAMFMNQGLPIADGNPVSWQDHAPKTWGTAAVWLALLAALGTASLIRPRLSRILGAAAAIALVIVQSIGVASLLLNPEALTAMGAEKFECTEDGLFELAPENNVVVFVLDTYDTNDLLRIHEIAPDCFLPFEDFTLFSNVTGSMVPTRYGVPFLTTAALPEKGKSFDEFYENRYNNSTFLPDVAAADYSIGLYSDSLELDFDTDKEKEIARSTVNLHSTEKKQINAMETIKMLAKSALYRDLPWALKPSFWYYTDEMNNAMVTLSADERDDASTLYQMNDPAYYEKLTTKRLSVVDEGTAGAFRFIHLNGTHIPYLMDESCTEVGEGNATLDQQAEGALNIVGEYLEQMKELGVYDSSTIVVTADHGYWYSTPDMVAGPTSPIMLVKPANDSGSRKPMAISNAPVSHMDFHPTVIEAIGGDSDAYGDTVFEINDPGRKRLYYMTTSNGRHDTGIREIEISGDALDFNNWKLTGNDWPITPPED